jgi:hypothetical protein
MFRHMAATVLGMSVLGGCSKGPGPAVTGDLALLFTGNVSGFLEPCG